MFPLSFTNRDSVFDYIVQTFAMYYDAVDIVQVNKYEVMILSSTENEPYFNFCIHKDGDLNECIKRTTPTFKHHNREPLFYISPASSYFDKPIPLERFSDDAFMFLEDETVLKNYKLDETVKIELCQDEEAFVKVWGDARRDPNDIYGIASDEMINGMRRFFKTPPQGFNHFATMAYKNGIPAANVVSVYNKDFLLVIGLGTLPHFRKQGLGTALMKDIIERAQSLGIKTITLQTETNSYNENFYKKIGFTTKFSGAYYKIKTN